MSEKNLFPAELRVLLLAGAVGVMVTAGGLAAMAALMTAQGYSGAAAPPLATAAVGAGSLCSGWIAAFCKKERGLLCGLVQGLLYAALLVVLSVPSGTLTEEPPNDPHRKCLHRCRDIIRKPGRKPAGCSSVPF